MDEKEREKGLRGRERARRPVICVLLSINYKSQRRSKHLSVFQPRKKTRLVWGKKTKKRRLTILRHPPDMGKDGEAIYVVFQRSSAHFPFGYQGSHLYLSTQRIEKKSKLPSMTTQRKSERENWKLFCHRPYEQSHKKPAASGEAGGRVNKVDYPAIISVAPHAIIA